MGVFYVPKALNRFYSTVGFILHFLAYLILVVVRGVAIYWVDNGTGVYIFKNFEDLGENEKLDMKKQVLSDFLPTNLPINGGGMIFQEIYTPVMRGPYVLIN